MKNDTTVTITAGTVLRDELTGENFEALLGWFTRNGIEPSRLPTGREIVIEPGWVDYWAIGLDRPDGSVSVAYEMESGELGFSHLRTPTVEPLSPHLFTVLTNIRLKWISLQANIAGQLAAAKVWSETQR